MRTQEQIDFVNRWIEALRSGNYTQGKSRLRSYTNTFCCLGVLADIQTVPCKLPEGEDAYTYHFDGYREMGGYEAILPGPYYKAFTGFELDQGYLATKNDSGMSFEQIANILERMNTADGDRIYQLTPDSELLYKP